MVMVIGDSDRDGDGDGVNVQQLPPSHGRMLSKEAMCVNCLVQQPWPMSQAAVRVTDAEVAH